VDSNGCVVLRVARTAGELPEPVHAGEGGDQSNGRAHDTCGLPVEDLSELLVAHLVFVLEYFNQLFGGKPQGDLPRARVTEGAATQRDPAAPAHRSTR
jgi:hypothetical protein